MKKLFLTTLFSLMAFGYFTSANAVVVPPHEGCYVEPINDDHCDTRLLRNPRNGGFFQGVCVDRCFYTAHCFDEGLGWSFYEDSDPYNCSMYIADIIDFE